MSATVGRSSPAAMSRLSRSRQASGSIPISGSTVSSPEVALPDTTGLRSVVVVRATSSVVPAVAIVSGTRSLSATYQQRHATPSSTVATKNPSSRLTCSVVAPVQLVSRVVTGSSRAKSRRVSIRSARASCRSSAASRRFASLTSTPSASSLAISEMCVTRNAVQSVRQRLASFAASFAR